MAISSSNKLTKYISATTIVTADVANSWFIKIMLASS